MDQVESLSFKNVIWAVDVFTDIQQVEEMAAKNIANFFKSLKINPKITPVNVFPGVHVNEYFPFAQQEIQCRLSTITEIELEPIKVIPENMIYPTSVEDKVLTLIDHAKETHCDLIIVTTHSQQTASHLVIGSFTNELLDQSPIPLLILNPSCEEQREYKSILCPVESGEFADREVEMLASITEKMSAKITFFYHVQNQADRYFHSESSMWKVLKSHQRKIEQRIEEQQGKLQQSLNSKKLNFEIVVEIDTFSFKESISQYVRARGISLILLGGVGSRLNKKISKNVMEFVMRNAYCPVLIVK